MIPFFLFIFLYVFLDPFRIIYRQDSPHDLHWNRDVQGSRLFIQNNSKHHYSSFIMGNSECMAFMSKTWGKYIGDSIPFHFDASSEDINSIYNKLNYLDKIGNPIKNVLLITDPTVYRGTGTENQFGYNHDYKIDGSSAIKFHYIFFSGFITHFLFVGYIDYSLNKTYRTYMHGSIPDDMEQFIYDSITNDWILQNRLQSIKADSLKFYSNSHIFYERKGTALAFEPCISESCLVTLKKIKQLFEKHNTHYKIVLGPIYSQRPTNKADIERLNQVFGKENVFDFSGVNTYSSNIGNYLDNVHYKPYIGAQLLKVIYASKDSLAH